MIAYTKSRLKIVEFHFNEATYVPERVDVVRYHCRPEKVSGTHTYLFHSITIDLREEPEKLLAQMNSTSRNQIRKALKLNEFNFEYFQNPEPALVEEFFEFYDEFAKLTDLVSANRPRLSGIRDAGALVLSRTTSVEGGETLVWHCYLVCGEFTRLIHSASHRRKADKEHANVVARANRTHHYLDMLRFREAGLATLDLGGWYSGKEDQEKLHINRFKESLGGQVVEQFNTDHGVTLRGFLAVHARRFAGHFRGLK